MSGDSIMRDDPSPQILPAPPEASVRMKAPRPYDNFYVYDTHYRAGADGEFLALQRHSAELTKAGCSLPALSKL